LNTLIEGKKFISETLRHVSEINTPTLIMHAVDDESVHIRNAENILAQIRSSDKELIYLGNSYHMITIDNERETVHQETLRFIKNKVNETLERQVFEIPSVVSPELRRFLKQQTF